VWSLCGVLGNPSHGIVGVERMSLTTTTTPTELEDSELLGNDSDDELAASRNNGSSGHSHCTHVLYKCLRVWSNVTRGAAGEHSDQIACR